MYLIVGASLFLYVLARTLFVGITFDESYTIGVLSSRPFKEVLLYNPAAANNHLLNSIFIKLIYLTGFKSTFAARLPNLFSLLIYLFFAYRICSNYFEKWLGVCLFLLLISNPFVLDFFGLARGYGLALSFMMASIYYLLKYNKELKKRDSIKALCFGGLAVLSNYTFLFLWLNMFAAIHMIAFIKNRYSLSKIFQSSSGIGILLTSIIYYPISKLREAEALWYGGIQSSYSDTLYSLMNYSLAQEVEGAKVAILLNVFLVTLSVILGLFLIAHRSKKTKWPLGPIILTFLFLGPLVLNTFLHYTFDTKFLINRTAIFLLPISSMTFAFCVQYNTSKQSAIFVRGLLFLFVITSLINLGNNANLRRTINWYYDATVPDVLEYIDTKGKKEGKTFILDSTKLFSSSIQYYKWKKKYNNVVYIKTLKDNLDKSQADYFLFLTDPQGDIGYDPSLEESLKYPRTSVLTFEKEKVVLWSNLKEDNLTSGH